MPPGGDLKPIYVNFSAVETLNCMKATRFECGLAAQYVVKFQRDRDEIMGNICDFVNTVSVNEMELE